MPQASSVQPIIIIKKKAAHPGGHHGGAHVGDRLAPAQAERAHDGVGLLPAGTLRRFLPRDHAREVAGIAVASGGVPVVTGHEPVR